MRYGPQSDIAVSKLPDDGKWIILFRRNRNQPPTWMHLDDIVEFREMPAPLHREGDWIVTDRGVEWLAGNFTVQIDDLRIADKELDLRFYRVSGYVEQDLTLCLEWARKNMRRPKVDNAGSRRTRGLSLRFDVLKRDGYKCCLCGRSAQQHGVVLEVDHKHARARGGKDTLDNLWTLCFDCNRGKRDKEL